MISRRTFASLFPALGAFLKTAAADCKTKPPATTKPRPKPVCPDEEGRMSPITCCDWITCDPKLSPAHPELYMSCTPVYPGTVCFSDFSYGSGWLAVTDPKWHDDGNGDIMDEDGVRQASVNYTTGRLYNWKDWPPIRFAATYCV